MSYLKNSEVSVDPFARNFDLCTYTNDLNPNTQAQYHMTAVDFLKMIADKGIEPDLIVFDPPYSRNQVKASYQNVGIEYMKKESQNAIFWYAEKKIIAQMMRPTTVFLHFGFHSSGMGNKYGFAIEEILLVNHGTGHYDTICMAERRTSEQIRLFPPNQQLHLTGYRRK